MSPEKKLEALQLRHARLVQDQKYIIEDARRAIKRNRAMQREVMAEIRALAKEWR